MKIVKAVIFDLYGVLGLNGWQAFKEKHFGAHPQAWQHLQALGQRVDAGEASYDELVKSVAEAAGTSMAAVRYQLEHTVRNELLVDFIRMRLWGRYKIGLLSNASSDVASRLFEPNPDVAGLFDAVVTSYQVGLTKPDPRMFLLICERLGVHPDECIMVDDQQRHLDAAAGLGMSTVFYESLQKTTKELASYL